MFVNGTRPEHFTLLGFPGLHPQYYSPVSAVMFLVFLAIAFGNMCILVFVMYEKNIQKPSYLIFCHLALNDLTFGTATLPKIIAMYWFEDDLISFHGCFVQMFFVHYLGAVQSFNLMVMALDRFISICLPMRYPVYITNTSVSVLCATAWFIPLPIMITVVMQASTRRTIGWNCYGGTDSGRHIRLQGRERTGRSRVRHSPPGGERSWDEPPPTDCGRSGEGCNR
uniref:G-protein coupled receptors family 1 profile domain-containing protein n=1 Tax=Knipowitschia caucasica TaxID=637954 RepID=A0AAV2J2Y5_KNICA